MKKLISMLLAITLVLSCFGLTALAAMPAEMYEAAAALMIEGKYVEAAEAFDALMTYSDAANMAMYCRAVYAAMLQRTRCIRLRSTLFRHWETSRTARKWRNIMPA